MLDSSPSHISGFLKQQCLDHSGLYEWVKKKFRLVIYSGVFEEVGSSNIVQSSLLGAKYAKAWSVSSSLSGFGFDVMWTSGKIWSFLADDQSTCEEWVAGFNLSVSKMAVSPGRPPIHPTPTSTATTASIATVDNPFNSLDRGAVDRITNTEDLERQSRGIRFLDTGVDGDLKAAAAPSSSSGSHERTRSTSIQSPSVLVPLTPTSRQQDPSLSLGSEWKPHATNTHLDFDFEKSRQSSSGLNFSDMAPVVGDKNQSSPGSEGSSNGSDGGGSKVSSVSRGSQGSLERALCISGDMRSSDFRQSHLQDSPILPPHPPPSIIPTSVGAAAATSRLNRERDSGAGGGSAPLVAQKRDTQPKFGSAPSNTVAEAAAAASGPGFSTAAPSVDTSGGELRKEVEFLRIKYAELSEWAQQKMRRDDAAAGSSLPPSGRTEEPHQQPQLEQLEEYRDRILVLELQLRGAREREAKAVQEVRRELETQSLRASVSSASAHEGQMRALKEQHHREIGCLKEELAAERKRFSGAVGRESEMRQQSEGRELQLAHEVAALKAELQRAIADCSHLRDQTQLDRESWARDVKQLRLECDQRVAALEADRDSVAAHAKSELRTKVNQMKDEFSGSVRNIEASVTEGTRQELEGQRLRELATIQSRCTRDIEKARTEAQKSAAIELEKLRASYVERERQTGEDLMKLEELHQARVTRLEQKISELSQKCEYLDRCGHDATFQRGQVEEKLQEVTQKQQKQIHEHVAAAERLTRKLEQAHVEVSEARAREASYREQLSRALEEARLLRAEMLEAKRQASDGSAQAHIWKQTARQCDLTTTAAATSVQIAQDEVVMLEHELGRRNEEILSLREALEKADKVLFGNAHKRFSEIRGRHDSTATGLGAANSTTLARGCTADRGSSRGGGIENVIPGHTSPPTRTPSTVKNSISSTRGRSKTATKRTSTRGGLDNTAGGASKCMAKAAMGTGATSAGHDAARRIGGHWDSSPGACSRSPERCTAAAHLQHHPHMHVAYYTAGGSSNNRTPSPGGIAERGIAANANRLVDSVAAVSERQRSPYTAVSSAMLNSKMYSPAIPNPFQAAAKCV